MRERLIVPAYLLAAIFFTGTCPTRATAEDWVQFRHDLSNTGKSGETTISSANVASLKVKWKTYFGGTGSTPAVVTVNGTSTVFIPTNTGAIYAINAVTGAVIWNQQLPSSVTEVYSSPAVANNILYIGANDGRLYAMNATTHAILWSYPSSPQAYSEVYSEPFVYNGVVYFWDCLAG
jgi:outer membrane protein assembly factor BamB